MNTDSTNEFNANNLTNISFKPFSETNLTDNYLFGRVFREGEYFKGLVSLLLNQEVEIIEPVNLDNEVSETNLRGYRSVRFDVLLKDTKQLIDLEMQNLQRREDPLPERASIYTANLVQRSLRSGESYGKKLTTYVLFLCNFDPFDLGDYQYIAKYKCFARSLQKFTKYNTRDYHYFFNLKSTIDTMPPSIKELYKFITETSTYKCNQNTPEFVDFLGKEIKKMKGLKQESNRYDDYMLDILEGEARGEAKGKAEGKLTLLIEQTRKCLNLGLTFAEAFDRLFITDPSTQEKVKAILNS